MLDSFKRLFLRQGHDRDLTLISDWAQQRGYGFKRARGEDGFVIDGQLDGRPWRIEWGPPQRDYIRGHELRLRMELDLSSDAQMLALQLVFTTTCWFTFTRLISPRQPAGRHADAALAAYYALTLLSPYVVGEARDSLNYLRAKYLR